MEAPLSRTRTLIRSALGAAVLGTALLLAGCGAPAAPVVTETPKPEPDFGSIGGETPEPLETGNPVEPTEPAAEGFTALTDDYGVLSLQVPADWTDVDGAPFTTDDGQEWASLVASTDIDTYFQSYSVSGVEFAGEPMPEGVTPEALQGFLESVANYFISDCEQIDSDPAYDDGTYVGYQAGFENCGGTDTEGFAIVAVDEANTHLVFLRAQIAGEDDPAAVYDVLVRSFLANISRAAASK
jgi:serine protease Do